MILLHCLFEELWYNEALSASPRVALWAVWLPPWLAWINLPLPYRTILSTVCQIEFLTWEHLDQQQKQIPLL